MHESFHAITTFNSSELKITQMAVNNRIENHLWHIHTLGYDNTLIMSKTRELVFEIFCTRETIVNNDVCYISK
jgi:hypothetical protein